MADCDRSLRALVPLIGAVALLAGASATPAQHARTPEVVVNSPDDGAVGAATAYNPDRDEFLVVWRSRVLADCTVRGRVLDGRGRPKAPVFDVSPITPGHWRDWPDVVWDAEAGVYLVVFEYDYSGTGSDWDIQMRRVGGDGVPLPGEWAVANTASSERQPKVAFSRLTHQYLVAWAKQDPPESRVMVALFAWGADIDPVQLAGPTKAFGDVAWQYWGNRFLVVYYGGGDVFGRLVGGDGSLGAEIVIAGWPAYESDAAVGACGNYQFFVAWESAEGNADVYGRFLQGDGSFWGAPIHFDSDSNLQLDPDESCLHGGIEYLVTFNYEFDAIDASYVVGQQVRATGEARESFLFPASRDILPASAGGPSGWLVAYTRITNGGSDSDVIARVAWELLLDDFELATTAIWSATGP